MTANLKALHEKVSHHLQAIYADVVLDRPVGELATALMQTMRIDNDDDIIAPQSHCNYWDEDDVVMITYGDSITDGHEKPLFTLHRFLNTYCVNTINNVHILPFFPYSSDDGFAVIDYSQVDPDLGSWEDVQHIAHHCSHLIHYSVHKHIKQPGIHHASMT